MRNCTSGSDGDRCAYATCHSGVEIDIGFRRPDTDNQGVSCCLIVSLQLGAQSPPPKRWVDGNTLPACEISGGPPPDVSMQRAFVTILCADQPRRISMIPRGSLFFISRRCVYPATERVDRFKRPLDVETKAVGRVSIARSDTSLRWVIPTVIDQNPCAHLRMPRDMIFHGWSMRLFQAWQHSATMSS